MRLQAMHEFTAKLPLASMEITAEKALGDTTETALQGGALWGIALEIEGYERWCQEKFGAVQIILTGGDADFFANQLKSKIFVHQNLVLVGLNKILNYNVDLLE